MQPIERKHIPPLSRRHRAQAQPGHALRALLRRVRNFSLLVAISVNAEGYRENLSIVEGANEDKAGWSSFLKHLKERDLSGVELVTSDTCLGLVESITDVYPQARWKRCVVQ